VPGGKELAIVFGAGGLGSVARYGVGLWVGARDFPYATLIVNVVGSFLIALVVELAARLADFPPSLRLALATGFLGGFTTYSSFNNETLAQFLDGHPLRGTANLAATVLGCAVAGLVGLWLARRFA
jgi:CrcB protein